MPLKSCAAVVCLFAFTASAATVDEVLRKMDAAAPKFNGMTSTLKRKVYTKVIDDTAEESGVMWLQRLKSREIQARIDLKKPDEKTVAFRGRKAEIYYPKLKTVQEYDIGKGSDLVEQFLLLGFGTSGKDLEANYTIKLAGQETIEGVRTHRLELVPKSAARRERLSKLELWIAEAEIYPVQQKFWQGSGDFTTVTYLDVKINPPIAENSIKLDLPKGVKREYPQK